jgi:hypothetical protein
MAGFSTYLANSVAAYTLNGSPIVSISGRYFALFTADPTDAFTTANEVSAAWYARQSTGAFSAPSSGVTYNLNTVQFPAVTGAPVTITHIGIVDAVTGGNLLYSQALTTPKTLNINDVFVISNGVGTGDCTITFL